MKNQSRFNKLSASAGSADDLATSVARMESWRRPGKKQAETHAIFAALIINSPEHVLQ
jgi:hypothetical protein